MKTRALIPFLQHIEQEKKEDEDKGSNPFLFTIGFREEKQKKELLVSGATS
jgi:hypothetical protein